MEKESIIHEINNILLNSGIDIQIKKNIKYCFDVKAEYPILSMRDKLYFETKLDCEELRILSNIYLWIKEISIFQLSEDSIFEYVTNFIFEKKCLEILTSKNIKKKKK